jgi:hypothetical protein
VDELDVNNLNDMNLWQIPIVDPDPTALTKWRTLLRRKSICNAQWSYFENFEEYVEAVCC